MKPTLYTVVFIFLIGTSLSSAAQTLISVNSSTTMNSGSICSNCIVKIASGVTLTLDGTVSCTTCTFTGGTVVVKSGSNITLNGVDSFKNSTVYINQSFNQNNNITFYGDTVAFNASMNFGNGRTNIDSSRVSINAALTLKSGTLDKDSLHVNANLTLSNATDTFSNSNVTVASGKQISTNTTNFINNVFSFNGSSSMNVSNGMTSSGTSYYLSGTSTISSSSTSLSGDNVVMNGTTNGFTTSNTLTMTNTTVTMNSSTSSSMTGNTMTASGGSITGTAGASFAISNAVSLTNTPILMTGSGASFSSGSLTATSGSLTAGSGASMSITNATNLTNTPVTVTSGTFSAGSTTLTGGNFSATGSTVNFASLTTSGISFTASGSNVTSTNAVNMTNTTASFTNVNFQGNSLTTSGGSITTLNSNLTSTNAINFTNTPVSFQGGLMKGNSLSVSGSSFDLNNTPVTITNADNFTNATVTMSGTASLTGNSGSLSGSTMTMNGTSSVSVTNAWNVDGSAMYLNGDATLSSGSMNDSHHSWFKIGDGTIGSTAHTSVSGGFSVDNTSNVGIANNNNYLYIPSGPNSLKNNTISCNGGGTQHSCSTGYVYGCGTISSSTGVGCIILATAKIDLTATPAGPGQVSIVFADQETSAADHYLVQRNAGDNQWNTISTVNAGTYTGEYRYTDADAPAGSIEYRIERIDPDGKVLYSSVATVNVEANSSTISIHPNPATGGTFYITTSYTGELIVNVFTLTGQLLYHTEGKGQTQYGIRLPAQAQGLGSVIVQTISQAGSRTFTVLVR
jgi:hypothetical protein